jgi:2-polyprenyl-3-methyl-5-hydroxy-6-metoxy-1,4-benzoquinol methylase
MTTIVSPQDQRDARPSAASVRSPQDQRDALAERIFGACNASLELYCVFIGDRLGLYRALAASGPATAPELAATAGLHPRYAREWLEQQAVAGYVDVADPDAAPDERSFSLPPGHAEALADPDSLAYSAPLARLATCVTAPIGAVMEAMRTGGGVPWSAYGADGREGQADLNRVQFLNFLGTEWLPSLPDVDARLRAPGARVADLACGAGWSSIAIARAYPEVHVDGFDVDEASIDLARANAEAEGLSGRVRFHVRDVAANLEPAGGYDLVTVLEALHDMAHPVAALAAVRALAAPDGAVLVMDERTNERLTVGDPVEQFFYAASVLLCLPTGMSEAHSAGTGTVMRPDTLRGYAASAGFADVEVLTIEHPFFRFYRLR